MERLSRWGLGGCFVSLPWPAWAAQSNPGIDPTLFVIGVAGAFAAGVAVGYAVGKSSSSNGSNKDG